MTGAAKTIRTPERENMQLSDVIQLAKLLDKSGLTEISFSDEATKVVLKKEGLRFEPIPQPVHHVSTPVPVAAAPVTLISQPTEAAPAPEKPASNLKDVTSPMVGTFYASSSPGGVPLVQVGSVVKQGQIVCIIEAMKIMNEIECDVAGVIQEVCASNETPVEYGTVLFRVGPG